MSQHISPPTAAGGLRHDRMPDRTGWTVYDAFESRPVRLGGIILAGLSFEDAEELVRILNRQELEIEREARRLVLAAAPRCPALPTTLCVREAAHAHQ
jgi:hypothetical protein